MQTLQSNRNANTNERHNRLLLSSRNTLLSFNLHNDITAFLFTNTYVKGFLPKAQRITKSNPVHPGHPVMIGVKF